MKKLLTLISLVAIGSVLSACGQSSAVAPKTQENVASGILQFAVGSANIAGTANAGLNVVVTYRQPSGGYHPGDSATLLNEPSITVPTTVSGITVGTGLGGFVGPPPAFASDDPCSTALTGRGSSESGSTITSTGQAANENCASVTTTFGQSGGAFGLGIEPWNSIGTQQVEYACCIQSPGVLGTPYQVTPYAVPLWDTAQGSDPNAFIPWGGPPAFQYPGMLISGTWTSPLDNANVPTGSILDDLTAGVSEGIDVFEGIGVVGGTYSLSVKVPANTGFVTQTASAAGAVNNLGTAIAPTFVYDGTGGGTFTVTMPTGATEAYVEVTDDGLGGGPMGAYYTMLAETSGATSSCSAVTAGVATCTLPDAAGPGGTPSVVSGDDLGIWLVGFDYPAFEIDYPASNGDPAPTITGAGSTDDITISAANCQTVGGAAGSCAGEVFVSSKHRKGAQGVRHGSGTIMGLYAKP